MTDELGRPVITDEQRERIRQAFSAVPQGKTFAVLVIADTETEDVRAHVAIASPGGGFKVAGGLGWQLKEKRPRGWIAVEYSW